MCGICGLAGFSNRGLLEQMTEIMRYRGPDDVGYFVEPKIGLGCRRLSIIDLPGGKQPVFNEDNSVAVVQNGEIYNYLELRKELEIQGHTFKTRSDTEVLVHAYEAYGDSFLTHLNGDFALAVWDRRKERLLLARDRAGVHPLYYYQRGSELAFSSELKSLLCWDKVPRDIDLAAVDAYLTLRYIPEGKTLFKNVRKLAPASYLVFESGRVTISRYWHLPELTRGKTPSVQESAEALSDLLRDAVRLRLRSDVPVGVYLSGGLDSTLLLSLMRDSNPGDIKSFTIGFGLPTDELNLARQSANRYHTDHTEVMIGPRDFELLPQIVWHLDDPIGDAIVIPTFRLAQAAGSQMKVTLSGEGADEVWGGYIHHTVLYYLERWHQLFPSWPLRCAAQLIDRLPSHWLNKLFPYPAALGERGRKIAANFFRQASGQTLQENYFQLASAFRAEDKELLYGEAMKAHHAQSTSPAALQLDGEKMDSFRSVLNFDFHNWLPDYTLLKQDKLGLAHSLEVRVPYLDHRLVEFAWRLPDSMKLKGLTNKFLLRKAAAATLPKEAAHAPKKAFYLPPEKVFNEKFDSFVQDILGGTRCRQRGLFSNAYLDERLRRVRTHELLDNKQIFSLLTLELWFETFVDAPGRAPEPARAAR